MNHPPHIAGDFVEPPGDVVRVEDGDPVELSVDPLLDPDPEDQLYYAVIGEHTGLVEQATVGRRPTDDLYRDRFVVFDGVDVRIDPCTPRLRDRDAELVRLHVTDRPFERLTDAEVEIDEEGWLVTHRWLLRFGPDICD